ncbi:MAG: pseudouridine synthase, partial [Mobilitalea sp.]
VTARKDAVNKTVLDYFEPTIAKGLFPVGRLDKDTEGLLLLTNDGEFSHSLMHPNKHVEKTYFFKALGFIDLLAKERLINGIDIGQDGSKSDICRDKKNAYEKDQLAKAIKIEIVEAGQYQELWSRFDSEKLSSISINPDDQKVVSGYLTISEGRKHQVKRMLKAVGCYVIYLKRVSIGGLQLDTSIEVGQYRQLTADEIKQLYQ